MSVVYPPLREQWFGNVRGDVLSGILVALALIPEAIAFSIIAGVDPRVGLYASFCIAVVTSIAGGALVLGSLLAKGLVERRLERRLREAPVASRKSW